MSSLFTFLFVLLGIQFFISSAQGGVASPSSFPKQYRQKMLQPNDESIETASVLLKDIRHLLQWLNTAIDEELQTEDTQSHFLQGVGNSKYFKLLPKLTSATGQDNGEDDNIIIPSKAMRRFSDSEYKKLSEESILGRLRKRQHNQSNHFDGAHPKRNNYMLLRKGRDTSSQEEDEVHQKGLSFVPLQKVSLLEKE